MGGKWSHRRDAAAHKRARKALLPGVVPGETPCYRCRHPLEAGDLIQLDHAGDGSYGGFSHGSPCRVCGKRCNQRAGGIKAALLAGKQLRDRACVICGKNFTASRGTDGSLAATCGSRDCVRQIRAMRKARLDDPDPPPQTGRPW